MPNPDWPKGPTFYAEQHIRPYFPTQPPSLLPYGAWGQIHATTVWSEAGRCKGAGAAPPGFGPTVAAMQGSPRVDSPYALAWWMHGQGFRPGGAGQSGDEAYLNELASSAPTEARPYLERGDWPPTPGSREYSEVIKPQFVDRMDEQHYLDWWYAHFTTDGPRYTLPPLPGTAEPPADVPPAVQPPASEPPVRPPRDWPAQEPLDEPTTITTTGTPTTAEEPSRARWGWIVGGSAALLLIGGGVAYVVTRPKKRSDGGRQSRRRR